MLYSLQSVVEAFGYFYKSWSYIVNARICQGTVIILILLLVS